MTKVGFVPAADHLPEFAERSRRFGDKVRRRHDELGLTERELIERTGLSRGYIQLLLNNRGSHKDPETGSYKPANPTLDVIWRLAEALELDAPYLVDNDRDVESRAMP
jgi:transcriptional regulator with XRE-family HTH domain